jgi:tight adherence protein B
MIGREYFAAATALIVALSSPVAVQQPAFRSRVEGIRVDVLVADRGKPISNLKAADFEVRDNGVVQVITVTPRANTPLRVLLTVDSSRSVRGARLDQLRSAVEALLRELEPVDEVRLLTFDQSLSERVPWTHDFDRIDRALMEIEAKNDTALVDATLAGMLVGDSDPSRSLVLIFSDGADTASFVSEKVALEMARSANVVVYGIWSGKEGNSGFLREVAEVSGGRVIDIGRSEGLTSAFLTILAEFRQRYLITFTPTGVATTGWHRLEVRVKGRNATVRARRGYVVPAPQ